MSFLGQMLRTSYYVGVALRHTMTLVSVPYRAIAGRIGHPDLRFKKAQAGKSRRREIVSRLSRMKNRLSSLERALLDPDPLAAESPVSTVMHRARQSAEAAVDALADALANPDPGVRQYAMGTVEDLGGEEASVLILEGFNDPDPGVRRSAAMAARKTGAHSAVFSLILLLDDPEPEVSLEARHAIESITGQEVQFDPSEDAPARKKKIEKLKQWWKKERFARLAADVKSVLKS